MVRAVRGATTANENGVEEILDATEELLKELMDKNDIMYCDIGSDKGISGESGKKPWLYGYSTS